MMRVSTSMLLVAVMLSIAGAWAVADEPTRSAEPTPEATPEDLEDTGEEPEDPPANTLKWTTASEVDNFGFDIYRGLDEEGPFDRITDEPLPGAGTTDEPQNYVFVDRDIDPTRDYFYYIESISLGGVREVFSPVIRAPAKQPADDGGE
jgi:hypothetical protein